MRALDSYVPFFDLLLSVQPLLIGLSLLTDENALPGLLAVAIATKARAKALGPRNGPEEWYSS